MAAIGYPVLTQSNNEKSLGVEMLSKKIQHEMVNRIVEAIHPLKIILFGSHSSGNAGPDSDIDLIVVTETPLPKRQTSVALWNLLGNIPLPKDIIIASRDEFDFYSQEAGSVMRTAHEKGLVIYAR